MISGIAAGLTSALLISISFVFSRAHIRKYGDPVQLAVHSQLVMGVGGIVMLLASLFFQPIPLNNQRFLLLLAGDVGFFLIAQTSFFIVIKQVEASRASSLLGLKLIVLALIAVLIGKPISPLQWLAIILCTIAAVGMNFSGGRLALRSVFWLMLSVLFYALCDSCIAEMMLMMPGKSMLTNSFGVIGISYTALALAALPATWKYPFRKKPMLDTIPYGAFYFISILFLMTCYGLIGVVFGSIMQAGRGVISVLLGILLIRLGVEKTEPMVSPRLWIQRGMMALLMLTAMVLYTCASLR